MAAKLYVVVRQDLEPSQRTVQACHAAVDFAIRHQAEAAWWNARSNHVAILGVKDLRQLEATLDGARRAGLKTVAFTEPDMRGNPMTAIAVQPGEASKRLLRKLRLSR